MGGGDVDPNASTALAGTRLTTRRRLITSPRLIGAAVAVTVVCFLVVLVGGDVGSAARQLGHIRWRWAAVAASAGIASLLAFAGVRLVLLRAAAGRMTVAGAIRLTLASGAIAASVPAGGAVATAYTFSQYRAAGADDGAATWALFVNGVITPGVLAVVGLLGASVASPSGSAAAVGPIGAAAVFVAVAGVVWHRPSLLVPPVALGLRVVNALRRRPRVDVTDIATGVIGRFAAVRLRAPVLMAAVMLQLLSWLVDIACLAASIVAVGGTVPWRDLVAVYTASQLIGRIPLLPGGLGQIETGLVVGLHASGVPIGVALAATLTYRLASQWLVVPLGWPAWWLQRRGRAAVPDDRDVLADGHPTAVAASGDVVAPEQAGRDLPRFVDASTAPEHEHLLNS